MEKNTHIDGELIPEDLDVRCDIADHYGPNEMREVLLHVKGSVEFDPYHAETLEEAFALMVVSPEALMKIKPRGKTPKKSDWHALFFATLLRQGGYMPYYEFEQHLLVGMADYNYAQAAFNELKGYDLPAFMFSLSRVNSDVDGDEMAHQTKTCLNALNEDFSPIRKQLRKAEDLERMRAIVEDPDAFIEGQMSELARENEAFRDFEVKRLRSLIKATGLQLEQIASGEKGEEDDVMRECSFFMVNYVGIVAILHGLPFLKVEEQRDFFHSLAFHQMVHYLKKSIKLIDKLPPKATLPDRKLKLVSLLRLIDAVCRKCLEEAGL